MNRMERRSRFDYNTLKNGDLYISVHAENTSGQLDKRINLKRMKKVFHRIDEYSNEIVFTEI